MGLASNTTACGSLVEITRSLWKPLIPRLDEISLNIMSFYAEDPIREYTLYRVAREVNANLATVYKKGRILASMRLLEFTGRAFKANSKTCIALYALERLGPRRLYECLQEIWGFKDASEFELLSFLALLAFSISLRDLNITNANICFFDEASLHVVRLYRLISISGVRPRKIICKTISGEDKPFTHVDLFSKLVGLPKDVVIPGIRLAFRGVTEIMPPTIVGEKHRIWLRLSDGSYRILMVECKHNCGHYYEDLGLSCPIVHRDVMNALKLNLVPSNLG